MLGHRSCFERPRCPACNRFGVPPRRPWDTEERTICYVCIMEENEDTHTARLLAAELIREGL